MLPGCLVIQKRMTDLALFRRLTSFQPVRFAALTFKYFWEIGFDFIKYSFSLAGLKQCQRERQRSLGWNGRPAPGVFVPECDTDGEYESTQCHESSGFCWCVDTEGNEIPRTRTRGRAICRPSGKFVLKIYSVTYQTVSQDVEHKLRNGRDNCVRSSSQWQNHLVGGNAKDI